MYSVNDYLGMLGDRIRREAYTAGIRHAVRAGDVVIDLGAGIGYFGVLAAILGAERVHLIDPNPAVHLATRIAAANDVSERVVVHCAEASFVMLSERADVIVADMRGPLPFADAALASLIEARERWLRPGGMMIAARDRLFVAPCRAPIGLRDEIWPVLRDRAVNLGPVERVVFDTPVRCSLDPEDLSGEAVSWGTIEYATLSSPNHSGNAALQVTEDREVEGLAAWFESDIVPGVHLSSAPGSGVRAYGQVFFPLGRPVRARRLEVRLDLRLVNGSSVWAWHVVADGALVAHRNSIAEIVVDPAAL